MKVALLRTTALFLAMAAGGCGQPRTPESPGDADAGELSCSERAQAQTLCQGALTQRCESQSRDCESGCDAHDLPANDRKTPSERNAIEADQCRTNCQHGRDGCLHTVVARCPVPCTDVPPIVNAPPAPASPPPAVAVQESVAPGPFADGGDTLLPPPRSLVAPSPATPSPVTLRDGGN